MVVCFIRDIYRNLRIWISQEKSESLCSAQANFDRIGVDYALGCRTLCTASKARCTLERRSCTSSSPTLILTRSGSTSKDLAWHVLVMAWLTYDWCTYPV